MPDARSGCSLTALLALLAPSVAGPAHAAALLLAYSPSGGQPPFALLDGCRWWRRRVRQGAGAAGVEGVGIPP